MGIPPFLFFFVLVLHSSARWHSWCYDSRWCLHLPQTASRARCSSNTWKTIWPGRRSQSQPLARQVPFNNGAASHAMHSCGGALPLTHRPSHLQRGSNDFLAQFGMHFLVVHYWLPWAFSACCTIGPYSLQTQSNQVWYSPCSLLAGCSMQSTKWCARGVCCTSFLHSLRRYRPLERCGFDHW